MYVTLQPIALTALRDNYIWVIPNNKNLTVIDPGEAQPVLDYCKENALTITTILITHHHYDHTGGLATLKQHFPTAQLVGPSDLDACPPDTAIYPHTTHVHTTNPARTWSILHTPGHTMDHVCYYSAPHLFCGDTLFSAGCGRAFEGSYQDLFQSLQTIQKLPPETGVYPAHEYTLQNCEFALSVDPDNEDLQKAYIKAKRLRAKNQTTLPTTLAHEQRINPFLRTHEPTLHNHLNKITATTYSNTLEVFTTLRKLKDNY